MSVCVNKVGIAAFSWLPSHTTATQFALMALLTRSPPCFLQGFNLMANIATSAGLRQVSVVASMSQRPRNRSDVRLLAVRLVVSCL